MEYKEILTYRLVSDGARIFSNAIEFNKLVGTLTDKHNISGICVTNDDAVNLRAITVNDKSLPYASYYAVNVPTPGGRIEVADLDIKFPNGDAIVSIIIERTVNLAYKKIPVIE